MTPSPTTLPADRRLTYADSGAVGRQTPAGTGSLPYDPGEGFWYELSETALRIGLGEFLVRCVPYWRIERVERGWAPGLQLGGPGMPGRGDEVRIRSSDPLGLPWLNLTPPDQCGFVRRLSDRLARAEKPDRAPVGAVR